MSFGVSGPGEPLMSRNYLAILQHIADVGYPALSVALTTNGTLLTPEFLRRHAAVRWSHVRISLNAGSARTHARMTGKSLFDRVLHNLDALCALRDSRPPPFPVTLSCVLSEMVMGDLHAFAEIATRYRTDVVVEPMYGDMNELSPWTRPEKLTRLADELGSVAHDFALRNPPLSRAFRGVEEFARRRLALGDFSVLAHH
jgi:MoaA/NifB/PqqE/SkfB family radical SAM enzyme